MQILVGLGKALLFVAGQATVLIAVVQAVRWNARRKDRLDQG